MLEDDVDEIKELLKLEMRDMLAQEIAKELGLAFFGENRFVIGYDGDNWVPYPCAGYYPMEWPSLGAKADTEYGLQLDHNPKLEERRSPWNSRKSGSPSPSSPSTP